MGAVTRRESNSHSRDLKVRVRQIRWEAEGVVSLLLENSDGSPLPEWEPGSHLDLNLPNGLVRNYSLCGDVDSDTWRIGVLREAAGGGGSAFIHDLLRVGSVLSGHGPRNNFFLETAQSYLFIAGGIGITPMLAMIAYAEKLGIPWRLLYGGRERVSMAFTSELQAYGERVRIHPHDEYGLLPLSKVLSKPTPGELVYCCGPEPLLSAVESAMKNWPGGSLFVERFKSAAVQPKTGGQIEVVAQASGITVFVAPDQSILAALEAAGINVPNSCREGICGTCETNIVEGIADHRDSLLSDSERESNSTLMVCVSRCTGPRLVLDI